jgi:hypothetical protein
MKSAFISIAGATRSLLRDWQVAAVFGGVSATLVAALYLFVTTEEATLSQVLFTFMLALIVILLFYVFQTMGISYTRREMRPNALVLHALKNFWKPLLISLPLIPLVWLVIYLVGLNLTSGPLNFYPSEWPTIAGHPLSFYFNGKASTPTHWQEIFSATWRLTLYGIVLPLAALHLWIAAAHDGLKLSFKRVGHILLSAYKPQPVLIYTIGLIVFGFMPCLLVLIRTPVSNGWVEVGILTARLILAFLFFLFGWVITLGALTETGMTKVSENVQNA